MIEKIEPIGKMTGFRIKIKGIKQKETSIQDIIISSEVAIKAKQDPEKNNEVTIKVTAKKFKGKIQEVIGINANPAIFVNRFVLDQKTMKIIISPVEDPSK